MKKEIFISESMGESRIAIVEDSTLVEVYVEKQDQQRMVGNIYKGPAEQLNEESYKLSGLQPIGYYAVRPFWRDGHNAGIFTFELLKKLGDALDSSEV